MNLNHSHHYSVYYTICCYSNCYHHRKKQEQSIVSIQNANESRRRRRKRRKNELNLINSACNNTTTATCDNLTCLNIKKLFSDIFHLLLFLVFRKQNSIRTKLFSSSSQSVLLCLILPILLTTKSSCVLADQQLDQPTQLSNNLTNVDEQEILIEPTFNNKFKIYDCNEQYNVNDHKNVKNSNTNHNYVKFNKELFYHELNMHETLINLYKSCFKEFVDMHLDEFDFDNFWIDNPNPIDKRVEGDHAKEQDYFCRRHEIFEEILFQIVNTPNKIFLPDVANRIRYVCKSEVNLNNDVIKVKPLDKLFLLSSYEHDLCGNIYRNSMSRAHLLNDVLKVNSKRQLKLLDKSTKADSNVKTNQQQQQAAAAASNLESTNLEFKYLLKNFVNSDQEPTQLAYVSSAKQIDNYLTYNYVNSNLNSNNNNYSLTESRNLTKRDASSSQSSSSSGTHTNNNNYTKEVDNCTLILLNTYLLAFKSTCENRDFVTNLGHYDCASNYFSVKSNCKSCQEAYAKWLCSSNIPYFENGRLAKSCQRFCFSVQNMCPFFRPMDDNFGAQPLFHCRNVVQVSEERPDGYEDDDEHYEGDDINDDDKCYSECSEDRQGEVIPTDLDVVFNENLPSDSQNKNLSLIDAWSRSKSPLSTYYRLLFNEQPKSTFNMNARYSKTKECIFNSVSSSKLPSSSVSLTDFKQKTKLILVFILVKFIINEFRNY